MEQKEKGITLIALIVTIIVLLLLASVSIATLFGENGLLSNAGKTKIETKKAEYKEQINLMITESQMEIYQGSKETLKNLVTKKIEEKDWYKSSAISETNEDMAIVQTKDNFEIGIKMEEKQAYIVYIHYKGETKEPEGNTKITVTYQGNGGKSANQEENVSIEVEKNSTIILPQNSFIYEMNDFKAWVDEEGNEYQPGQEYEIKTKNVIFTAKWEYKIKEELPYLRTTGNQYIDTGYVANQDTSIEMQFQLLSRKDQFLYGARVKGKDQTYSLIYGNASDSITTVSMEGFRGDYNNTLYRVASGGYENVQLVKQEKNCIYLNGKTQTYPYANFTAGGEGKNNNLYLFNVNESGNAMDLLYADLKFYYCKIWDGDILIRDFIPVIDKQDKICLYDKVEQKFYYAKYGKNQEEFERDKEVTKLDCIECNGKQYIDTQIKPNQNTSIEMKCKIDNASDQTLFGSRTTNMSKTFTTFFLNADNNIRCDYNTTQTKIGAITIGKEFTIKQNKNIFYLNNIQKASTSYNNFNGDYNLYLFAVNTAGTTQLKANLQFYYCKIWDGDTLVRDFIPVMKKDNSIHIYDKVTSEYYESKEAEFLLGGKIKK